MPIYTVTCRQHPEAQPEDIFIDALSAGQARAHAADIGRLVESVAITPRDRIKGDAVLLAGDFDPLEPPVCAECRYSLDGLPLLGNIIRCPECGHANRFAALGKKASVIRSTSWDVRRLDRTLPEPGRVAGVWAVVMAVLGLFHMGPALLAVALAVYALERSGRRHGLVGLGLGTLAVVLHVVSSLA